MVERIKTTVAKAKAAKPWAEKMVTLAKEGTQFARRKARAFLQTDESVRKLFDQLGPRFKDRIGGYTRLVLAGRRYGDNAPVAYLEYIDNKLPWQISLKQDLINKGLFDKVKEQMHINNIKRRGFFASSIVGGPVTVVPPNLPKDPRLS